MNKSESKYQNTAILMDEALLLLLEKKEFEFITVKEICEKAGVNRSTFYLHYENVGDLLRETVELIGRRFYGSFEKKSYDAASSSPEQSFFITPDHLIPYLQFVRENRRIFSLIHRKPELFNVNRTAEKMYREVFSPILDKFGVKESEKPYVFAFYTEGTLAIVMKWVERECREEIADIASTIMSVIGHQNDKK